MTDISIPAVLVSLGYLIVVVIIIATRE